MYSNLLWLDGATQFDVGDPMKTANGGNGEEVGATKYLGWRIFTGGLVVLFGLGAVVASLALVLDNYSVSEPTTPATAATAGAEPGAVVETGAADGAPAGDAAGAGQAGEAEEAPAPAVEVPAAVTTADSASVSASSVVAILTPVMAGIIGMAGLFFGISATGSARGREAEAGQVVAEVQAVANPPAPNPPAPNPNPPPTPNPPAPF